MTITKSELSADATAVSEIVSSFHLPVVESGTLDSVTKAIHGATKATLHEVLSAEGPKVYADPTAAETTARRYVLAAKDLEKQAEAMTINATYIVRAARTVDPSITLVAIGRAVERVEGTASSALKQRWSRVGLAIDLVDASELSVKDGKRKQAITVKSAIRAAKKATEPRDVLRKMARDGEDMPTGGKVTGEQTAADGQTAQRVFSGADVVRAAQTLADRCKRLDREKITRENVREIERLLNACRDYLAGREPATPATVAAAEKVATTA